MESIVAIDIETTGLDPVRDAIIEVAAVRFKGNRIEAKWETLVNPRKSIPQQITKLTGISNEMVRFAPLFQDVSQELEAFVGDSPVLGHNIRFDLGFLQQRGVLKFVDALDTYDLAAVLNPSAGRYNLGAVGQFLRIPLPATHRAMDDALLTHAVFVQLYEQVLAMPLELLAELVRLGDQVEWGGGEAFRRALRERSKEKLNARQVREGAAGPLFRRSPPPAPLIPDSEPVPLDIDAVAAILEPGGVFSRQFPQFEYRSEQVEMLRHVTWALSEGRHLLVEAGTGTGKSLAYLLPAALWALENNTRVVVSTNTINLQDQLINKDIPDIREALNTPLRAVVLKGRGNYLCPRRFELLRRRGGSNGDEARVLAKVMVWLSQGGTGDRQELNLTGPGERAVWERISAADDACTGETCQRRVGGRCPFFQARQEAQSAHIIIVNHALLLADVATGNRVLPEYEYLIVDEAHHLESAVTNALSFRITQFDIERVLRELGGNNSGVMGRLLSEASGSVPPDHFGALNRLVDQTTDQAIRFQNQVREFFISIDSFLLAMREGRDLGMYAYQVRILPGTRTQPSWLDVEVAWDEAQRTLEVLIKSVEQLGLAAAEMMEAGLEAFEDIYGTVSNMFRSLGELNENLNGLVFNPVEDRVYWAEIHASQRRLSLQSAPLHIGPLMEKHIWHEKVAVILTSATLTTHGDFEYMRSRLNAVDADDIALGSPFDYESQALLYFPNNIPEPSDRYGHQNAVDRSLIRLCKTTGGRTLVLFTSYAQLQKTSQAITPALTKAGVIVYEQGAGASPHTLVENFKASEQAVLLGTRSFWEGVDIPGEALSILVIVKLPFDVPSDPIIAARSETFEDPFHQYALPEAILAFRQGFGRLIRTKYDRGLAVILDRRVLTKQYGRMFVESLPQCTVQVGPIEELENAAARWLNW